MLKKLGEILKKGREIAGQLLSVLARDDGMQVSYCAQTFNTSSVAPHPMAANSGCDDTNVPTTSKYGRIFSSKVAMPSNTFFPQILSRLIAWKALTFLTSSSAEEQLFNMSWF